MRKYFLLTACAVFLFLAADCQDIKKDSLANGDELILTKVEKMAGFEGGDGAWAKFIKKNLRYEVPISMGAPEGTYKITVRFVVGKDGTVKDIVPESHYGYGMEAELIGIMKRSPKWIPATQNGRPVNAYRRQTVNFDIVYE